MHSNKETHAQQLYVCRAVALTHRQLVAKVEQSVHIAHERVAKDHDC